jgi:hypothetical protein
VDRTPLDFVHPIVRAAVYDDLPAFERTDSHARSARLLDADGADPNGSPPSCCRASRPAIRGWWTGFATPPRRR